MKTQEEIERELAENQAKAQSIGKYNWAVYLIFALAIAGAASALYLSITLKWPWE